MAARNTSIEAHANDNDEQTRDQREADRERTAEARAAETYGHTSHRRDSYR